MKVFLSWSGPLSLKVACAFRDWLPSVIQSVKPYVSSEDIDKGARWSTDIAEELKESSFGIICVTRDNISAPWINFEAGALSKTFDKSKVCPLLFNVKRSEVQGPLLLFQSALCEEGEIEKLVASINGSLPEHDRLDETRLRRVFEVWWPELKQQLEALLKEEPQEPQPKAGAAKESTHAILEELLELARSQTKLLRSPPDLLPPDYFQAVLDRYGRPAMDEPMVRDAIRFLLDRLDALTEAVEVVKKAGELKADSPEFGRIARSTLELGDVSHFFRREMLPRRPLRKPQKP